MKTLYWIGAEPRVQVVIDGRCTDIQPNSSVQVDDASAASMISSGNWTATSPTKTPAVEPEND